MNHPGLTPEELLSTLIGKPSKETLNKVRAAMADTGSEIHAFLHAFEEFAKRARDPDALNWEAYILPPSPDVPNEQDQQAQIRQILGEVYRSYWRPDAPLLLPQNRKVVDAVCRGLPWFDTLDLAGKRWVYQTTGKELASLRAQTLTTIADAYTDAATQSAAQQQAQKLSKKAECISLLEEAIPVRVEAYKLSEDAGRLHREVAELLGIEEIIATEYIREVEVEISLEE